MQGNEHFTVPMQIATMVVPVAVYFLILGLLNTRRHPQLISGRCDFALLIVALSPLFVLPALNYVGASSVALLLATAGVAAAIWVLAPRGRSWVIYNMPIGRARDAIGRTLEAMGCQPRQLGGGFRLDRLDATIEIGGFSLLQNVSVRLRGGDDSFSRQFETNLARLLAGVRAEPSPMAMGMLLVATGMLVAPLTLVAQHAGQIVRILTDLLN